jgi:tRNA (guanine37-N1)-methyltransferase
MWFDVLTLFPEMFPGYLGQSVLSAAIERGLVDIRLHNIRDWAEGRHKVVDDRPFGGGPGMVLKAEPVVECVEAVQALGAPGHLVMLTPQGRKLNQQVVEELAGKPRLLLLCGRYEGFDDRVRQILQPDEISIGDFVLSGGELAAMVIIDTVVRLVPGVLGHEESNKQDSFSGDERLLEFGQYTRPRVYRGLEVPEILLSGNHEQIAQWRHEQSLSKTRERRADLLPPAENTELQTNKRRTKTNHRADDSSRRGTTRKENQ